MVKKTRGKTKGNKCSVVSLRDVCKNSKNKAKCERRVKKKRGCS